MATLKIEENLWRVSPDYYAERASQGKWIRYKHLAYCAKIVRDGIYKGNARLIFTQPPRHGKSEFFTHWVPTWFLDTWPDKKVIIASYGDRLAKFFGRKVKNELLNNSLVQAKINYDSRAAMDFETTQGGGIVTAGIGGAITGRGGDLCIIDDPTKTIEEAMSANVRESHKEWFNSTFYTRLEPGGSIILIMTRWHEDDLAGWLMREHQDNWKLINLPALAEPNGLLQRPDGDALCEERFDKDALEKIKSAMGSRLFAALYQGHPSPQEGSIWKKQYWKRWNTLPEKFDRFITSWDPNIKEDGSSYVVGQVWGKLGASRYLVDQVRGKWGFNDMKLKVTQVSAKYPQANTHLFEDKATGPALKNQLDSTISGIILVNPKGGKDVRAMACEPELEAGNVFLPADEVMYPWVMGFLEETAVFPYGENDDQVDAASQALSYLRESQAPILLEKTEKKMNFRDKLGRGIR